MPKSHWEPQQECAPIPELVIRLEAKLAESNVFELAARSPLYQGCWQAAGINPAAIKSYADLQSLPYVDSATMRITQAKHHPDEFMCGDEAPRLWVSTSGSTGIPKWVPVSAQDMEITQDIIQRFAHYDMGEVTPDDVIFAILAPAPFMSDSSLWPIFIDEATGHSHPYLQGTEILAFSYEDAIDGVGTALKRGVSIMFAFPSLIMRFAEGVTENAALIAKNQLEDHFNFTNLLGYLVTRVKEIRPRDIVKIHTGMFGGEPLAPYKKALEESWGLKRSFNYYTFSEFRIGFFECRAQDGLHVWMDICLPEIIPEDELERERNQPGYVPRARPLWEANPGDQGELVLTGFSPTFPLVRWRTSDMIHVVSTAPCECGRTHPRVLFLQRSDDMINIGVIRFSIYTVQERLEALTQPASIARWQLRVGRDGYKPKLTVLVRPASEVDQAQMIAAVREALYSIKSLRMGYENGLVHEPVVQIAPDLGESTSSTGKLRPLVYDD